MALATVNQELFPGNRVTQATKREKINVEFSITDQKKQVKL
jgi:hypothetical protein